MPASFEAYTARSGACGDHSGRKETAARKRRSQFVKLAPTAADANRSSRDTVACASTGSWPSAATAASPRTPRRRGRASSRTPSSASSRPTSCWRSTRRATTSAATTRPTTLTYVWLDAGDARRRSASSADADFAQRIQRGDVATDLIRPVHPLRAGLAFDYGRALYHALFRGLAAARRRRDRLRPDGTQRTRSSGRCSSSASCLRSPSAYAFRFLYNLAAFWMLDYRGAMRIADRGRRVLLGLHHSRPLLPGLAADARVRDAVPEHAPAAGRRLRRL